jgi:tellurite resistance protein TehA-like permease
MDFLPEIFGGAVLSALLFWAAQKRGPRVLWLCALGISLALAWIFYRQWHRLPIKEAPLVAHILAGLIPPLVVAGLVSGLRGRIPLALILVFGTLGFVLAYFGMALVGTYVLGDLLG